MRKYCGFENIFSQDVDRLTCFQPPAPSYYEKWFLESCLSVWMHVHLASVKMAEEILFLFSTLMKLSIPGQCLVDLNIPALKNRGL
jgi:hypothetical protein